MRTTKTKTLTAAGQTDSILVQVGVRLLYAIVGTFLATWVLERSTDGGATWQTIDIGDGELSGEFTIMQLPASAQRALYRLRAYAFDAITPGEVTLTVTADTRDKVKFIDGTAYTVTADDAGRILYTLSATAVTITVPDETTEQLGVGFECEIVKGAAGDILVAKTGSDSVRSASSHNTLDVLYASAKLTRLSATEWLARGLTATAV